MELPKFKAGDVVYYGRASWMNTKQQCPDCLGSGEWEVTTPAKEVFKVRCRTCWGGLNVSSGLVNSYDYKPTVERLTIGSVKYDSGDSSPFRYMCEETGVGSGSVYKEEDFSTTEKEAAAHARELVKEAVEGKIKQFEESRKRSKKEDLLHRPHKEQKIKEFEGKIKTLNERGYL